MLISAMADAKPSSRSAAATLLLLLSAISASCQGVSATAAAAQHKSQAGCACLDKWVDAQGGQHSGCANPDNDPQGPWCQVNPSACQGYYSSHVDYKGNSVFFDYCGDVRETTVKGCLCAPDWSFGTPGVGKPHYRDRCASPHKQGERICKVDYATCPPGTSTSEFDTCSNTTKTLTAQQQQQLGRATTHHNCKCHDTWWYAYADGTVEGFTGCANPDGDALGAWCAVDPEFCDNYAGQIKQAVNETLHYDYCEVQYKPLFAGACSLSLKEFDQCGGKAMCSDTGCMDAPWPGACCPEGTTCHRQNGFYHQCLSEENIGLLEQRLESGSYPDSGIFSALNGVPTLPGAQQTLPQLNPVTNFPGSSSSLGAIPGLTAPYGASVTEDIVRVYIKMKIETNYTDLEESPEKMAWFKNDITSWMKGIATDQSYVQGAGVDDLSPGLIVVAFLQFTPGTPLSVVQATMTRLTTDTANLYASTNLPTAWGKLLGSTVAQNAADLMDINSSPLTGGFLADPAAGLTGSTARFSASTATETAHGRDVSKTQKASTGRLGGGAIAGIVIGVLVVIAASGFVISRTLADKARKEHDADISKKLDYTTELKEVDLEDTEGNLASVCVSDGNRSMWSWLRKAETVKPVEVPGNKVAVSTAVSTVSSLTAHGSGSCIAANTPSTNTKHAPFPEDATLRGASDCGATDVHQTATQHAAAATAAPGTQNASVAASNSKEEAKPSNRSDTEVPAALPYNLRGPISTNLKHRRGSSTSGASNSSSISG